MDHKVFPGQRLGTAAWRNVNEQNKPLSGSLAWCDAHTHTKQCATSSILFLFCLAVSVSTFNFFPLPQEASEGIEHCIQ